MNSKPPCCIPGAAAHAREPAIEQRIDASSTPLGSNLIAFESGSFLMGTDSEVGYRADGEGPQRAVTVSAFSISACAVSNAEFDAFVCDSNYVSQAEQCGWSFVFQGSVPGGAELATRGTSSEAPWWLAVEGACWSRPEGPGSSVDGREDHPVTHISWHDANAYCRWSGTRLPSEAEWEMAARGALKNKTYPWGDELLPNGEHRCNIWQGDFPVADSGDDGYTNTAPVTAYQPNGSGLYNMVGNVWEWCNDWFSPNYHRVTGTTNPHYVIPSGRRSMRGGSFLCHHSYCNRYRVAARSSNTPDSSTNHCGFRVAV
jgi:formylglycine-generating enzyme required for sulfatase activity